MRFTAHQFCEYKLNHNTPSMSNITTSISERLLDILLFCHHLAPCPLWYEAAMLSYIKTRSVIDKTKKEFYYNNDARNV
jgi:hypothetical protein